MSETVKTWTDEYGDWKQVGNVLYHLKASQKFKDENPPAVPEPQQPTEIELLQQENAMLQMSMMEITMYAATQDERLQGQEQAILELSMIVAGGGL